MTGEFKYGDVALGVEAALPAVARPAPRGRSLRRLIHWMVATLRRWA